MKVLLGFAAPCATCMTSAVRTAQPNSQISQAQARKWNRDVPGAPVIRSVKSLALCFMLVSAGAALSAPCVAASTSSASLAMVTPTGFRNVDGWNQSLGLHGPLDLRGRQLWGHGGVDRGVANSFYFNTKTGVGAIVFANANDPDFSLSYAVDSITLHLISWFE
jgi:hypothetical protein